MSRPDLNLLFTLDVLLAEGSVAAAARRLRLSPSAMSRALARLRETTGDPLLVRAGRGLVPSPRAVELRERVARIVEEAQAALQPARRLELRKVKRSFTLRASEGFAETFGPALIAHLAEKAPGARLRFLPKTDRDSASLREGSVDLETGVVGQAMGPEVHAQALFRDRFVGVVRAGHPLAKGRMTLGRYADGRHIAVARRGEEKSPADDALGLLGLRREIATTVGGFATALSLARVTDLVATVPERHTAGLREGLHGFALPFAVPEITVSLLWHPRMQADPAHRWLRALVVDLVGDRARVESRNP